MNAKQIYPDCIRDELPFIPPYDYSPILDELGKNILQVDDDDYQGDSRVLLRQSTPPAWDPPLYGILIFGWGSCSGCDALQACNSYEDLDALIDQMRAKVIWGTKPQTIAFLKGHDWEGDYTNTDGNTARFVNAAIALLDDEAKHPITVSKTAAKINPRT